MSPISSSPGRAHVREVHVNCTLTNCMVCDLYTCAACGGAEGGLPTECPQRKLSMDEMDRIYGGFIDFRGGGWELLKVKQVLNFPKPHERVRRFSSAG